jgi:hypothetical protein
LKGCGSEHDKAESTVHGRLEIWPGSWNNIDARFPEAFRRYVYGDTPQGQYALPMTLEILRDHGLRGIFFVEPLFSARFGLGPLQEFVSLIQEGGQDVQMHLHPEWADEARESGFPFLQPASGSTCRTTRWRSRCHWSDGARPDSIRLALATPTFFVQAASDSIWIRSRPCTRAASLQTAVIPIAATARPQACSNISRRAPYLSNHGVLTVMWSSRSLSSTTAPGT